MRLVRHYIPLIDIFKPWLEIRVSGANPKKIKKTYKQALQRTVDEIKKVIGVDSSPKQEIKLAVFNMNEWCESKHQSLEALEIDEVWDEGECSNFKNYDHKPFLRDILEENKQNCEEFLTHAWLMVYIKQ